MNLRRADPIGMTESSIAYRAELMASAAVRLQAVTLAHSRREIAKNKKKKGAKK